MSNRPDLPATTPRAPIDRLSSLLGQFRVRAELFHTGPLCGMSHFEALAGRAFLHVLRQGELTVLHPPGGARRDDLASGGDLAHRPPTRRLVVREPALLFYPRARAHAFHNPPRDGAHFTCAALHFDGGDRHPLVAALPALIVLPLARVPALHATLDMLFEEADHPRCGSRLLLDRLFEVVLIQLLRWLVDHPSEAGIDRGLLWGLADARLARTLVALHEAPGAPWTLQAMAKAAGMSRSAFAAAFKEAIGSTPSAYLADWRLSLAAGHLRGGRAIKAMADELGYASPAALSRVFKQRLGIAPRAWKRAETGLPAA